MKKILIIVFILFHLLTYCQKRKKVAVYDPNEIELKDNTTFIGKDTLKIHLYENGEIFMKGRYAITKNGNITYLKIGHWIQYYRNGNVESEGNYDIGSYLDCGAGGLERIYYSYKIGNWKYYNANNTIDAAGKYITFKTHIDTRCEGGFDLVFMKLDDKWEFPNGQSDNLKGRINSSLFSDEFNDQLYYLKENGKVARKINQK